MIDPVHKAITGANQELDVNHVLDEGILRKLATLGQITPEIIEWLTKMVSSTAEAGADLAVVSCSSLSPCVDEVRKRVSIPVLKVDEPMMEYAVKNGDRIGLVMTNPTTKEPSQLLFRQISDRLDRHTELVLKLCSNAFAKLNSGDVTGHDMEVAEVTEALLKEVDFVMLAQISIARVKGNLDKSISNRVFSSLDFITAKINAILSG